MRFSLPPLTILFVLLLSFGRVCLASGQDGISGLVVDQDGAAVPRAHVRLLAADGGELAQGFADARGAFKFEQARCAGCRIEASLPGFAAGVATASSSPVRIALAIGPIREAVVVSATRGETPVSQVGSAVTVFDSEAIERRGTPLVGELLRSTPGVAVVRVGGFGNVTSMFVRGGESSYNKVLLDGIPLNEPGGTFDFSNITTQSLDRVELMRGAHSALFGTDAMASVVHLVTKRASRPTLVASFEAGSYDTQRAAVTAGAARGPWDVSAHASRYHTDNRVANNAFRNTTLSANGGMRISDDLSLRFVARGEIGRAGSPGATAFGRPDLDAFYARRLAVSGVTAQHVRGLWQQRATYGVSSSYAESTNLIADPPYTPAFEGRAAPFAFSDFTYDSLTDLTRHHASYQVDRRIATGGLDHQITGAIDWDGERAELRNRLAATLVPASRDNVGAAIQHQLLGPRFALTSGLRVERNDSFGTAVAPRLAFVYMLRDDESRVGDTRVKASAGAGVKEPTITQSFSPSPSFLGNPDLEPERARTFDAGIEQRLFNGRVKVEAHRLLRTVREHHLDAYAQLQSVPCAVLQHRSDPCPRNGAVGRDGSRHRTHGSRRPHVPRFRGDTQHVDQPGLCGRAMALPAAPPFRLHRRRMVVRAGVARCARDVRGRTRRQRLRLARAGADHQRRVPDVRHRRRLPRGAAPHDVHAN